MQTNTKSLQKYFDDGVVQYWWLSASNERDFRITAQPSGISIDKLSFSWNGRKCWQVAYSGFESLGQAEAILYSLAELARIRDVSAKTRLNNGFEVSEVTAEYRVA